MGSLQVWKRLEKMVDLIETQIFIDSQRSQVAMDSLCCGHGQKSLSVNRSATVSVPRFGANVFNFEIDSVGIRMLVRVRSQGSEPSNRYSFPSVDFSLWFCSVQSQNIHQCQVAVSANQGPETLGDIVPFVGKVHAVRIGLTFQMGQHTLNDRDFAWSIKVDRFTLPDIDFPIQHRGPVQICLETALESPNMCNPQMADMVTVLVDHL